ncbi:MAG TPA: glycosyltransferase family 2 protein [Fimbriimonadaceae bacterium]|nr:glycosyltransferase family 2 protein [Fimbriimonadaceae bacterium]
MTICSWNTAPQLRQCLEALQAVRQEAAFEVIVVDNNSQDESPDMVEREFPWVRLFRLPRNLGFTGGQNFAFEQRSAPHVFPLNSDAYVHPGCLRRVLEYAAENPDVGIIGPKLLNPDGSLQYSARRWPDPLAAAFRNTFLGRLFPNNRFTKNYLMQDWAHDEVRDVDWVSGAAFFARAELIQSVGVFDPAYYMFCEDVDWCFRAWRGGFRVVYLPDALVTHEIGRSTDLAPNRMIFRFHASMFRFYRKNMVPQAHPLARPLLVPLAAVGLTLRAGLFIVKNKVDIVRRWWQRRRSSRIPTGDSP